MINLRHSLIFAADQGQGSAVDTHRRAARPPRLTAAVLQKQQSLRLKAFSSGACIHLTRARAVAAGFFASMQLCGGSTSPSLTSTSGPSVTSRAVS